MDQLTTNYDNAISFFSNANFWIAIYGALLSTVLAIRELLKGRRRIKVICNLSITVNPQNKKPWWSIAIRIINRGYRPVTITSAALLLKNGETFVQPQNAIGQKSLSDTLPQKINDGEDIEIFFDYLELKKTLDNLKPPVFLDSVIAVDAEGKRYSGRLPKALKGKLKLPRNNGNRIKK